MKILIILCSLFFSVAHSKSLKTPPDFKFNNKLAVFVDFLSMNTKISFDVVTKKVIATSLIKFNQSRIGTPIFDLIPSPLLVELEGERLFFKTTSLPGGASTVKTLSKELKAGIYEIKIINKIDKNIRFTNKAVKSAFWMSDLTDRRYLEQYLPANLEYDQYKMSFEVEILNAQTEHLIRTNGEIKTLAKNHFKIDYPKYFTASSIFFHLMPIGSFPEEKFSFKSIDGREIPVVIYSARSLSPYVKKTKKVLAELEADYGAFPHNKIIIYGAGKGGMEHCGATITSLSALGHELIHSYFARGVMPARGNAGWIDEAVASWRDTGYRQYSTRRLSASKMAGHSVYRRTTDRDAYSKGARFMGHLDRKFSKSGGLIKFLKKFKDEYLFSTFLTKDFQSDLETYFGEGLSQEFSKYIYGTSRKVKTLPESLENPNHPRLSEAELLELL